jgi:hypothetical protein
LAWLLRPKLSTQTLKGCENSARRMILVDSKVLVASGAVRFAPKSRGDLLGRRWLKLYGFLPAAPRADLLEASLGVWTLNLDRSRFPETRLIIGPSGRSVVRFEMRLEVEDCIMSDFFLFIKCLKALAVLTLLGSYGWSDTLLDPHYMEVLQVDLYEDYCLVIPSFFLEVIVGIWYWKVFSNKPKSLNRSTLPLLFSKNCP